jgi:hypothetical protein
VLSVCSQGDGGVRRVSGGDEVQRHGGEVIEQTAETADRHAVIAAAGATLRFAASEMSAGAAGGIRACLGGRVRSE